jgi:hypothetical protein
MSTETEQPATTVENESAAAWQATLEEIAAELGETDPGPMAQTEDEMTLDRVLRLRGRLTAEYERVKDQTDAMLKQLENRIKGVDYVYQPILEDIAKRLITGKVKSLKRPYGTVGFRTTQPRLEVVDETQVPFGLFRLKREADRAAINKRFKETGEVVPGCEVVPAGEKFYVR